MSRQTLSRVSFFDRKAGGDPTAGCLLILDFFDEPVVVRVNSPSTSEVRRSPRLLKADS